QFQVSPAFMLGFTASYTEAQTNGPIDDLNARDGARVPYFPKFMASLQGSYTWETRFGDLLLQADFTHRDSVGTEFDTLAPAYRTIPANDVLNASLTLQQERMTWTLYGRNLTDERIVTAIAANNYGAAQPGDLVYLGRLLTVGQKAGFRF